MRTPRPLPPALQGLPLTPAALNEADISPERLRRGDLVSVARGIHASSAALSDPDTEPIAALSLRASLAARAFPSSWISHVTAAQLRGWWLPARLAADTQIHLSFPKSLQRHTTRSGVISHRMTHPESRPNIMHQAPVSRPMRTWLELAQFLAHQELVILGDHLVRTPYFRYEGRSAPWVRLDRFRDFLHTAPRLKGISKARLALGEVRVGSDSPAETMLRLAIVRAGLPEPMLQVAADAGDPRSPRADLGYPGAKIAIQYDGASHFVADQARKDQRRDNIFIAAGWWLLKLNRDDAAEGFVSAIAQLRALLADSGAAPAQLW